MKKSSIMLKLFFMKGIPLKHTFLRVFFTGFSLEIKIIFLFLFSANAAAL